MNVRIKLEDSHGYKCIRCDSTNPINCCAFYEISLYLGDIRGIWEKREELGIRKITDFVEPYESLRYWLKKKIDLDFSDCIFYDNGCELHRRFGKRYKPVICQIFPQQMRITHIDESKAEVMVWRDPTEPCPADSVPVESKIGEIEDTCKLFVRRYVEHIELIRRFGFAEDDKSLLEVINQPKTELEIEVEYAPCARLPAEIR